VGDPRTLAFAFLAAACLAAAAPADDAAPLVHGAPEVRAARAGGPISIDGRLDEDAWAAAPVAAGFRQREPQEGAPATEPTELRVLYDEGALYVGARLHDDAPDHIVRQLSRRDQVADADSFSVFLDPHHDHRTGVEFQVSAAGVQRDAAIYDDNFETDAWDAVWESAVTRDECGWTVEMRIPLSQLRFRAGDGHAWGINARRLVHRKTEESWLALVPRTENGLASRMAHLQGIEGLAPPRHLELLPYASAREERVAPVRAGDPFNDGSRELGSAGIDFKYGLTSSLALVGAINPDFGQVEVDPAVVNLTAYETFFDEKRPFFTEGGDVFTHFAKSGASDYWSFFYPEPQIFYSRRIGRAPQGRPTGVYVDTPVAATILGAVKLTGRTPGGWTVGVVEAVTGREDARLADGPARSTFEVEPLTNYFVARAQRGLGRRGAIGFLGTAVNRSLPESALGELLVGQAYVGGVDGHVFLDGHRDWVASGGLSGSTVQGSRASILRLQTAAQRYYQRPDAPHVRIDPFATSLAGWSGRLGINRNRGTVTGNAGVWGISPGFEPNDAGFATQTDRGGAHGLVLWRKLSPDRWTRTRQVWVSKWWTFNFGGESQGDGVQSAVNLELLNYWRVNLTLQRSWATLDDKLTRGGPTTIRPGIAGLNASVVSDSRRRFYGSASLNLQRRDFGSWTRALGGELDLRPSSTLTLAVAPAFMRVHTTAQYLSTVADPIATATYGARYVFGRLDQTELAVPLRVNLVLSPRLSLQLYTQALLSSGAYPAITELAAPRTYDFPAYGVDTGTITRDPAGSYVIDPDGAGPAASFPLADPDFNVKSLRANAVVRWEFRLGSTLYYVWTQRRQDGSHPGDSALGRDARVLFRAPADDVFMVKLAWWIGR